MREAREHAGHKPNPERHAELTPLAIVDAEEAGSNLLAAVKYMTDPLHGASEKAVELGTEGVNGEQGGETSAEGAEAGTSASGAEGHHAQDPSQAAPQQGADAGSRHGASAGTEDVASHADALHKLAEEGTPSGVSDLATTLGLGAAMLPLSALAIHTGYRELREVAEQRTLLEQQKDALQHQRDSLPAAAQSGPAQAAVQAQTLALDQTIDDVAHQQLINRHDGRVAGASVTSASLIFAKTAVETSVQAGLSIASGHANAANLVAHSASAAGAASAATVAGTFVLGPAASVMATVLGGVFLHQSHVEKKRFRADFKRVSAFLDGVGAEGLGHETKQYHDFLKTKFDQRNRFVNGFNNWNKGFVVGGVTYTASTAAKVGVGIAAVAGASAVAGPVGLGLLISAGLLGAVTMGVGSHQFVLTHGKVKRYRNYDREDAAGIDRAFLAMADLLPAAAHGGPAALAQTPPVQEGATPSSQADSDAESPSETSSYASALSRTLSEPDDTAPSLPADSDIDSRSDISSYASALPGTPSELDETEASIHAEEGIESASEISAHAPPPTAQHAGPVPAEPQGFVLRSALYQATDGHERALGGFLRQAAESLQKRYKDRGRSTDQAPPAAPAHKRSVQREARAVLRGGLAYGKSLLTGHKPREARDQARQAHASKTGRLTETVLAQWLDSPQSRPMQVDYMRTAIDLQKRYLETKLAARESLRDLEDLLAGPDASLVPPASAESPETPASLSAKLRRARAADQAQLQMLQSLHGDLQMNLIDGPSAPLLLQSVRQHFLVAQTGTAHSPEHTARPFAHYCMKQAQTQATAVRGTLLATEMQAARVREREQQLRAGEVAPA
ncbi:type III secretion system effector protein XopK [Acidovorax sp. SUPP2825]|nr:type III secretion system effector protein XopK [Acidovorax sp. SUPP2825]